MVDQLQARIEREARFNSDVSHELRSPLTTLAASLEVLEARPGRAARRGPSGPCSCWATTCAGSSAWWATCSRYPGPTPDRPTCSSKRSTSASWCAGRSRPACAPSAKGAAAPQVLIDPDVETAHVGVDKRRFERVMANLLENAANYGGGADPDRSVDGQGAAGPTGQRSDRRSRSRTRARASPERTDQGLRALLPGLGVGAARRRHGYRARTGAGGRAHAPHARRGLGRVVCRRGGPLRHRTARRSTRTTPRRGEAPAAHCAPCSWAGSPWPPAGSRPRSSPARISPSRVPWLSPALAARAPPPPSPTPDLRCR